MTCIYCYNPCSLCLNTPSNCTSCIASYYQITNQLINDISINSSNSTIYGFSCLIQCPSRTLSVDNVTCQQCTSPCLICNVSLSSCLTCITGYYISSINSHLCIATCEQYSFANLTSGHCQLCSTISSLNCWDCISTT
jgi:hypothetical protein